MLRAPILRYALHTLPNSHPIRSLSTSSPRPIPSPPSFPPRTPPLEIQPLLPVARTYHALKQPPLVTFLLGGPGSGKGTLSSLIVSRHSHEHISVGALLRQAAQENTQEGRAIASIISTGGVVPQPTSTALLLRYLTNLHGRCIVDGFPRTLSHAILWESLGLRPYRVVALDVEERVMRRRLLGRGREDDLPVVIESRLRQFWNDWEAIKSFYRERGLLIAIDANGTSEHVWNNFENATEEW